MEWPARKITVICHAERGEGVGGREGGREAGQSRKNRRKTRRRLDANSSARLLFIRVGEEQPTQRLRPPLFPFLRAPYESAVIKRTDVVSVLAAPSSLSPPPRPLYMPSQSAVPCFADFVCLVIRSSESQIGMSSGFRRDDERSDENGEGGQRQSTRARTSPFHAQPEEAYW